MKRRELTADEKLEAERLNSAWLDYKAKNKGATQTWLAAESGLGTQGAVGQYLRGVIPLNLEALTAICHVIGVDPRGISPRLTSLVNLLITAAEAQGNELQRRLHDDIPGAFRANHNRFRKIGYPY